MPDGGLLFTLGDVSGKGIAAAVLMASIQASLRSQVVRATVSIAALIGDFNKAVYASSTEDKSSTLFCGLLDVRSRKLTYVNAGQVRAMLLRSGDGRVERLDTDGFPLGMLDAYEYEQGEVLLQPGDAVLCVSDGISEATNAKGGMWGEPEVVKIVRTCRGLSTQKMIDLVVEATDRFTGEAKPADDMTVSAIRA